MDWCCIFNQKGQFFVGSNLWASQPKKTAKLASSPSSVVVDLLSDEGATLQEDLWKLAQEEKTEELKSEVDPAVYNHVIEASFDRSLQTLENLYKEHGFTKRLPRVKQVLSGIQPFTGTVSTMVQSHPEIAALVWGSVQLIFQTIMRYTSIFEEISEMLQNLSKELPRFAMYADILRTPRLHQALREVYRTYLDFCFAVIRFLNSTQCYTLIKVHWSMVAREFNNTKVLLTASCTEFNAETGLANVQTQFDRHSAIMSRLCPPPAVSEAAQVSNLPASRNVMFTGRDEILAELHGHLDPNAARSDKSKGERRSCVVHGIGGIGKTETVLEYTYRYRACYSHIFWLHAQSSVTLMQSFLDATEKLGIYEEEVNVWKKVKSGLDWLQTSSDSWLMVFDNAEDARTVQQYIPGGVHGVIVMTSQNPDLVNLSSGDVHLLPMPVEEGRALIQRYLRRGGSEEAAAEELSRSLGGLPLAIAHFAGYVANSQCPIEHITNVLRQRLLSSQVWEWDGGAGTSGYEGTLATVWDLAWRRLSEDARTLLNMIAFLNPDSILEDMFIGNQNGIAGQAWQFWDIYRFNEAIRILRERHLVERDTVPDGASLRTHRALQRSLLQMLDRDFDKRQRVFNDVVDMVRHAFPRQNVTKRGDTSQWRMFEKYLPQVISINSAFRQSNPPIARSLTFASMLRDGGYYLLNNGAQVDAVDLLETVEMVCGNNFNENIGEARSILADSLCVLQFYKQFMGILGREKALELSTKVLEIRKQQLSGSPEEEWTDLDKVNFGRSYADLGVTHSQLERWEEARQDFEQALRYYSRVSDQDSITTRFGQVYSFQLWVLATSKRTTETRALADRAVNLVSSSVGVENHLTLQTKFCSAMAFFAIGDIAESLQVHEEILAVRKRLLGDDHHETLSSYYNTAVCYHNMGQLENAEGLLHEVLQHNCVTIQWRDEDIARTKFRLSIILRAQKKLLESDRLRAEALEKQSSRRDVHRNFEFTDRDDMELFDQGVTLWHGRNTGLWSVDENW